MSAVSAVTPELLSIREFARRDGCDESRVRRAIKTGHLKQLVGGKLDAAMVGTGWRETNRRRASRADTADKTVRTVRTLRTSAEEVAAPFEVQPGQAEYLAGMASVAAYEVAEALSGRLSRADIEAVVNHVTAGTRREAVLALNEQGIAPPPDCPSWAAHPLFSGPPLEAGQWPDLADDAGIQAGEAPHA